METIGRCFPQESGKFCTLFDTDLHAARDHLAEAADQADGLFKAGRSPFLSGLAARQAQAQAQAEQALAISEDQISADQVSLFLALGGGW